MTTTTHTRRITLDEAVAEINRRGKIIERLEARIGKLERALQLARGYVADELRQTLECACDLDKVTHEPLLNTLDERDRPYVESIRATLARIDAALGDTPGADGSDIFHHPTGRE